MAFITTSSHVRAIISFQHLAHINVCPPTGPGPGTAGAHVSLFDANPRAAGKREIRGFWFLDYGWKWKGNETNDVADNVARTSTVTRRLRRCFAVVAALEAASRISLGDRLPRATPGSTCCCLKIRRRRLASSYVRIPLSLFFFPLFHLLLCLSPLRPRVFFSTSLDKETTRRRDVTGNAFREAEQIHEERTCFAVWSIINWIN